MLGGPTRVLPALDLVLEADCVTSCTGRGLFDYPFQCRRPTVIYIHVRGQNAPHDVQQELPLFPIIVIITEFQFCAGNPAEPPSICFNESSPPWSSPFNTFVHPGCTAFVNSAFRGPCKQYLPAWLKHRANETFQDLLAGAACSLTPVARTSVCYFSLQRERESCCASLTNVVPSSVSCLLVCFCSLSTWGDI